MYSTLTKKQVAFLLSIMKDDDRIEFDLDGLLWIHSGKTWIDCYKLG